MQRKEVDFRTHRFLTDPALRTEYSEQVMHTLSEYFNTLFESSDFPFKELHREHNLVILPFGSILTGTAYQGVSDIDILALYSDQKLDFSYLLGRQPIQKDQIAPKLLGVENLNQWGPLDKALYPGIEPIGPPRLTIQVDTMESITRAIHDGTFTNIYNPLSRDPLELIAIVAAFIVPNDKVLPNSEALYQQTALNLEAIRRQLYASLVGFQRNNYLEYCMLQEHFDRIYRNYFFRAREKHSTEWQEQAGELFRRRGKKRAVGNIDRASRFLYRVREISNFPSLEELQALIR